VRKLVDSGINDAKFCLVMEDLVLAVQGADPYTSSVTCEPIRFVDSSNPYARFKLYFLARTHRYASNQMINSFHSEFDSSLGFECVDGETDSASLSETRAIRRVLAQPLRHRSRVQPFRMIAASGLRTRSEADQDTERLRRLLGKRLRIFDNFRQGLWCLFVTGLELPPLVQEVRAESTIKQMSRDGSCDPL